MSEYKSLDEYRFYTLLNDLEILESKLDELREMFDVFVKSQSEINILIGKRIDILEKRIDGEL